MKDVKMVAHTHWLDCLKCDAKFIQKSELKNHLGEVHDGVKFFKCDNCGNFLTSKNSLMKHIEIIHES